MMSTNRIMIDVNGRANHHVAYCLALLLLAPLSIPTLRAPRAKGERRNNTRFDFCSATI